MQVISAIDSSAIYAKVGEQYLYDNNGTLTGEPISALRNKQDAITFNYNGSDEITGINSSAIGGGTSFTGVSTASPITGDGLTNPLGLDYTTATYSSVNLINAIGSTGLYATSAGNSTRLNNQLASYYCSDNSARAYANFAGGNGITIAGELQQTKTIASNLTEYQLQEGIGISFDVDDVNQEVTFHAKPEVFLYYTSTPHMTYASIAFDTTNSAGYNTKGASGNVGISNTQITGLDSTKLYHCNVKLIVENDTSSPATVSVASTNWNGTDSITYEYVNSNNTGSMELDWYVKNQTSLTLTGSGGNANLQMGVKEVMVTEVCYA